MKALDLSKTTAKEFLQECDRFTMEIENVITNEVAPTVLTSSQKHHARELRFTLSPCCKNCVKCAGADNSEQDNYFP